MELLTHSRLRSFRACPRQHHYAFNLGARPRREHPALAFGSTIHRALETWWTTRDLDAAAAHLADIEDPFARARAEVMVAGYHAFWGGAGFDALAVEAEFRIPLLNPATGHASRTWQLAGKIDAILRGPDGRVWICEHKTTSESFAPGTSYRQRLVIDGQVSTYLLGAAALGFDVAGVLWDALRKPAQRPLEANTRRAAPESHEDYLARIGAAVAAKPDEYFARIEVPRLDTERDEFAFDVWQLARAIREQQLAGVAPRNPDACFRFGAPCPYFDVCAGSASIDDPLRFAQTGPHPELSREETGRAA